MKTIWNIGKLILGILFFYEAVRLVGSAENTAQILVMLLDPPVYDAESAREICEKEAGQEHPASVCFWHESPKVSVFCRETGQNCILTEVLTVGDSNLVIPGSSPIRLQPNGCMLDVNTAEELFGTREAAGQVIQDQGRSYVVCGTFESSGNILIRQMDGNVTDRAKELEHFSLRFRQTGNHKAQQDQFLMRYGLSGSGADLSMYAVLAGDMCLLVPVLTGLSLIRELLRHSKKIYRLAAVVLAVSLLWLIVHQFQIPPEMVPSRWSDFRFWRNLQKEQHQNLLILFGGVLVETQLFTLSALIRSVLCSWAACFLLYIP